VEEVCMSNITLSVDDELLEKSREYARRHRISLNSLIRTLLKRTVDQDSSLWLEDAFEKADEVNIYSGESRWTRDELYDV
jgi:hypothetical protein